MEAQNCLPGHYAEKQQRKQTPATSNKWTGTFSWTYDAWLFTCFVNRVAVDVAANRSQNHFVYENSASLRIGGSLFRVDCNLENLDKCSRYRTIWGARQTIFPSQERISQRTAELRL
jgi:hypothetical protein